ncbi:MAG: autoinducer binding domain-containing protein [Sulfitobacter sp.]
MTSTIPDFETELTEIRKVSTSGFYLVFGFSMSGTEMVHSEFDERWTTRYQQSSYFAVDPVFMWAISRTGCIRWSEINLPDVKGILTEAKPFGMVYGAIFAQELEGNRSFLSIARDDRELTDDEMHQMNANLMKWAAMIGPRVALSAGELDVLLALRDGLGQRDIAQFLSIAESTVKQRAISACAKLGAKTRAQAVGIAVKRNYI